MKRREFRNICGLALCKEIVHSLVVIAGQIAEDAQNYPEYIADDGDAYQERVDGVRACLDNFVTKQHGQLIEIGVEAAGIRLRGTIDRDDAIRRHLDAP